MLRSGLEGSVVALRNSFKCGQAQQTLELGGLYQGENLLVVNDPSADGVGFCCYEVRVNGMLTSDAVNSHAFEVDLGALGLTLGKGLSVRLKHRSGCVPRVLNPEVIQPIPGFQLVSFDACPDRRSVLGH